MIFLSILRYAGKFNNRINKKNTSRQKQHKKDQAQGPARDGKIFCHSLR